MEQLVWLAPEVVSPGLTLIFHGPAAPDRGETERDVP